MNESLISVQLLGAVSKPGIYYVPANTDLLKLLTLAGGSSSNGDVSEVIVRKQSTEEWLGLNHNAVAKKDDAFLVNAESFIKHGRPIRLKLSQDDFIYVPQKSGLLSQEAVRDVTFLSIVTGIVLSGLLIHRYAEQK